MAHELRIGIIGLGVGRQHIAGFTRHPAARVVSVCDFDPIVLRSVQADYPSLTCTTDADDVLTDPALDIVSIASYDNYHFEQVRACLEHGKHVFVEKPLCQTADQLAAIRELMRERQNLKLSSNLILRKIPRFASLHNDIHDGTYGKLFYMEADYNYGRLWKLTEGWRGQLDFYSVTQGGAIHVIDLLQWLSGQRVGKVTAFGNQIATQDTGFRFPDTVVALLEFESSLIAKVSANFACVHPHFHRVTVYGTQATFVNDLPEARIYRSRNPSAPPDRVTSEYPGIHKGDLLYSFVEAIQNGGSPEVTESEVFDSMSVCLAIDQSVRTGAPVAVRYE